MRITERTRLNNMTLAQNRAAQRLDRAARIAGSGQRVTKPSDDPAAYGAKVRRDHALAMLETHMKNATFAQNELEVVENSLDTAGDLITRARDAAVGGANTTADGAARKLLAADVRAIREELASIANTRYGDRYVFGGTRTDKMPFDLATGTWSGNDQAISIPVMDGVAPQLNVSGARAFTVTGGRDIFADLADLAKALDDNNETAIRAALGPLTADHQQIVRTQVEAGEGARRFRDAADVLIATRSAVVSRLSSEIEGDATAQITELSVARTTYERSVAVTKQLLSLRTE